MKLRKGEYYVDKRTGEIGRAVQDPDPYDVGSKNIVMDFPGKEFVSYLGVEHLLRRATLREIGKLLKLLNRVPGFRK